MNNYILLTEKEWHKGLYARLSSRKGEAWHLIDDKGEFNTDAVKKILPEKIFIPHWSYIIPAEIFEQYECIVFHMTDLPYGRGGSPLQNLITRGNKETKITALKVEAGLDTGDIYLKKDMKLDGSASEIFSRSVPLIEQMIIEIIEKELVPYPQKGEVELFKRRTPAESNITGLTELDAVYDHIRMLDADTYPRAFLETDSIKIEFFNAIKKNNEIEAHVRITKK